MKPLNPIMPPSSQQEPDLEPTFNVVAADSPGAEAEAENNNQILGRAPMNIEIMKENQRKSIIYEEDLGRYRREIHRQGKIHLAIYTVIITTALMVGSKFYVDYNLEEKHKLIKADVLRRVEIERAASDRRAEREMQLIDIMSPIEESKAIGRVMREMREKHETEAAKRANANEELRAKLEREQQESRRESQLRDIENKLDQQNRELRRQNSIREKEVHRLRFP